MSVGRDTIWFDAASPPQALWFSGLAGPLQARGFDLLVTARSHAGTAAVAETFLPILDAVIEGHRAGSNASKLKAILQRGLSLRRWALDHRPNQMIALTHNSYAQIVAARSLRIPTLTSMDYEGQSANHLAFRLADRILLPEAFPEDAARRQGASPEKTWRFPGIKEEVYLAGFRLDPESVTAWAHIKQPLAVVRPEAHFATYHGFSNQLVAPVVDHLIASGAHVVFVPRDDAQRQNALERWGKAIEVLTQPVNGPALLARADLVVSAGGTMTREAAALGTPSYSIFAGKTPAIDQYLIDRAKVRLVRTDEEISTIQVERKRVPHSAVPSTTRDAVLEAVDRFLTEISA